MGCCSPRRRCGTVVRHGPELDDRSPPDSGGPAAIGRDLRGNPRSPGGTAPQIVATARVRMPLTPTTQLSRGTARRSVTVPGALTFHDDQRRVGPIDGKVPWGDAVFVDEVVDGGSVTPAEMVATMSPWMLMTCQVRTPASVRVAPAFRCDVSPRPYRRRRASTQRPAGSPMLVLQPHVLACALDRVRQEGKLLATDVSPKQSGS